MCGSDPRAVFCKQASIEIDQLIFFYTVLARYDSSCAQAGRGRAWDRGRHCGKGKGACSCTHASIQHWSMANYWLIMCTERTYHTEKNAVSSGELSVRVRYVWHGGAGLPDQPPAPPRPDPTLPGGPACPQFFSALTGRRRWVGSSDAKGSCHWATA